MKVLIFLLMFVGAFAPARAAEHPRRLVALVDYIAGDYHNAVEGGKVVNAQEYAEMEEFSRRALVLVGELKGEKGGEVSGVASDLSALSRLIATKGDAREVAELAGRIKEKLLSIYKIVPHPRRIPSFQAGKTVYLENCAQCHGEKGAGDGPARESMQPKEPAPANFTDPTLVAGLSPFKAFNTMTFGIEGTAMASFAALPEDQRWEIAFYLLSLRFPPEAAREGKRLFAAHGLPAELKSASLLATRTDEELQERLKTHLPQSTEQLTVLAYLRRGVLQEGATEPLIITLTLLENAYALYEKGDREKAYQKAVEAYLDGFELAEPELFARDIAFARSLEGKLAALRNSLRSDNPQSAQELYEQVRADLERAQQILSAEESLPGSYVFLNAFMIIFREGLEAALILAAILALLKQIGAAHVTRYIHLGWVLALAAGLLTWLLTQTVLTLSGSQRESLEGVTTIVAAVVLFYAGYWLHTKAEARKWQQFIATRVQQALSGRNLIALIGISFFAVYREAFEVVLFYQALWFRSPSAGPVLWGLTSGTACLLVTVFALHRFSLKIPLRHFFIFTGGLLFLLAFVFAGQGVRELQTAGWVSVTPLAFLPQADLLGFYPTVETLAAQGLMLLGLLFSTVSFGRRHATSP